VSYYFVSKSLSKIFIPQKKTVLIQSKKRINIENHQKAGGKITSFMLILKTCFFKSLFGTY